MGSKTKAATKRSPFAAHLRHLDVNNLNEQLIIICQGTQEIKKKSGIHHCRHPSGMIIKYRISDALHVHYQRPLVHLSNTQALCWEPSQDLLIPASSSQSFFSRICILFFHWNCSLTGIYFVFRKLSWSRHSNILRICSVMLVVWLKIVIHFFEAAIMEIRLYSSYSKGLMVGCWFQLYFKCQISTAIPVTLMARDGAK